MITKGIIEEILPKYKVRVRLPLLNGMVQSTSGLKTNELSLATICVLPNISNVLNVGDIVFVGFEDNDLSKPIILGQLFSDKSFTTKINLDVAKFSTSSYTKLAMDTWIGNISPDEINSLYGVKGFIQKQLDDLDERLKKLEKD